VFPEIAITAVHGCSIDLKALPHGTPRQNLTN